MLPLAIFVLAMAAYVPSACADNRCANTDAFASSLAAWRIATTGEPWMEGVEFERIPFPGASNVWTGESQNGHLVTNRMFGPILTAVPFYAVAPYSEATFSVFRGALAAATMVAAAATLLFLSLRRALGDRLAAGAAATFAFTTPAWSIGADALWTHSLTMLGLAGAGYGVSRDRWWLAGMFLGLGMWGRPHLALVAAVVGLGMAWSRRSPKVAFGLGIPTMAALGTLAIWNHYVFDTWSPLGAYSQYEVSPTVSGGAAESTIGVFENWAGFLVSADRGIFIWTPAFLLLLPAVVRAWRRIPDWSRWLLFGGLAYSALQLALNWFGGGDGFYGYRHGLELLVCSVPVYVFAYRHAGSLLRLLTPPVVALQFVAILAGATTHGFVLNWSKTWTDNSFLVALREYPQVFVPLSAFSIVAAVALTYRLDGASRSDFPLDAHGEGVNGNPGNADQRLSEQAAEMTENPIAARTSSHRNLEPPGPCQ